MHRAADLLASSLAGVQYGNGLINFAMGPGDDVCGDDFADAPTGGRAGFDGAFNGADFTTDDARYQAGVDLFPADQHDVRGFHRGVRGFDHRYQTATFDQSQGFTFHLFTFF